MTGQDLFCSSVSRTGTPAPPGHHPGWTRSWLISAHRHPNISRTDIAPESRHRSSGREIAAGYNHRMAGGPLALVPELDDFRRQFEDVTTTVNALIEPLRDDQFTWCPEPGAWSVAHCLDHLNATARHYLPILDEGISQAIRRGIYGEG